MVREIQINELVGTVFGVELAHPGLIKDHLLGPIEIFTVKITIVRVAGKLKV